MIQWQFLKHNRTKVSNFNMFFSLSWAARKTSNILFLPFYHQILLICLLFIMLTFGIWVILVSSKKISAAWCNTGSFLTYIKIDGIWKGSFHLVVKPSGICGLQGHHSSRRERQKKTLALKSPEVTHATSALKSQN